MARAREGDLAVAHLLQSWPDTQEEQRAKTPWAGSHECFRVPKNVRSSKHLQCQLVAILEWLASFLAGLTFQQNNSTAKSGLEIAVTDLVSRDARDCKLCSETHAGQAATFTVSDCHAPMSFQRARTTLPSTSMWRWVWPLRYPWLDVARDN